MWIIGFHITDMLQADECTHEGGSCTQGSLDGPNARCFFPAYGAQPSVGSLSLMSLRCSGSTQVFKAKQPLCLVQGF